MDDGNPTQARSSSANSSFTGPDPFASRWTASRAMAWYQAHSWNMGFNFVPSTACNTTEMWQASTFDLPTIKKELALAAATGFTSTRVFIQYIVWQADPDGFRNRFNQFLEVAESHNISVVPVLFDDCAFGEPLQLDPFLGEQRDPIPGMVLSSWTPSPGNMIGTDPSEQANLKAYLQDMVSTYGADSRILFWDLFNEPMAKSQVGTISFLQTIFSWAREINPTQPLTVAVYGNMDKTLFSLCDVISFHAYMSTEKLEKEIANLRGFDTNTGYPVICTEWMARPLGGDFITGLPLLKSENVWCYQWGLVNGRTQTQFPWWNAAGGEVDSTHGWFHDIFHSDLTPYRPDEIAVIKAQALKL